MALKKFLNRFENSIFFALKVILIASLLFTFNIFFSKLVPQLKKVNRTSIITFVTFFISIIVMIKIYGGISIGNRISSEIRNSVILAVFFSNILTILILLIMSFSSARYLAVTNKDINQVSNFFKERHQIYSFLKLQFSKNFLPGMLALLLTYLLQILIICAFAKITSMLYFKINKPQKTIIIYDDENGLPNLVSKIRKNPSMWKIISIIKFNSSNILSEIKKNDTVFFLEIPEQQRTKLLNFCYKQSKKFYICPRISDVLVFNSKNLIIDDSTVFSSTTNHGLSYEQLLLKRILDIIFAVIVLILTSPLMLMVAIAIKLTDGGPILFKQKRVSRNESVFTLLKFRSMRVDSELISNKFLIQKNDTRITPIGKFIRRFKIDELPQLINVLRGNISVVGPRPEYIKEYSEHVEQVPEFKFRSKVKGGLTGLAQILGKCNTNPKDKLILDLTYIQNYSFWLDIKIMLQTLIVLLKSDSVESQKKLSDELIEFIKQKLK